MSSNPLFKKINIFLKVNEQTIDGYFNANDPAPVYKRQLSQEFEECMMNYAVSIKRYSSVTFKLNCIHVVETWRKETTELSYCKKRSININA